MLVEDAAPPVLADSGSIDKLSMNGSGLFSSLPPGDSSRQSEPALIPDSEKRALQRLASRAVPQDELSSTIETIVSKVKAADVAKYIQENDAQTFIDVIDEACHHATSQNLLLISVTFLRFTLARH